MTSDTAPHTDDRSLEGSPRPAAALANRMGRYVAVSVVNVVIHFSLLRFALWAWGWPGEWANTFAAALAAGPAFLLSRYWVWEVKGRAEVMAEMVPFWIIGAVGLVISSVMAGIADRFFDDALYIMAGSFLGYLMVWVGKFAVLGVLFDRSAGRQAARAA